VTAPTVSLADLTRSGAAALSPQRDRAQPPATALEWLGIAVARIPDLGSRARTADDVSWHSRTQSLALRKRMLDAMADSIAGTAAILGEALERHLERHPTTADPVRDAGDYADLLVEAHHDAPRRAELMMGGLASFLGTAIEAAGSLAEAELAAAQSRRWERGDPARLAEIRADQLYEALVHALGGLLAYARLTIADALRLD
jgi:hypothetical protein